MPRPPKVPAPCAGWGSPLAVSGHSPPSLARTQAGVESVEGVDNPETGSILGWLERAPAEPPAGSLAQDRRLGRHPGRGDRIRARFRSRGGEAVPDPVGIDGAVS